MASYEQFARVYDRLMADVDYDGWAGYLASFLPPGARVAECACGTGSLTVRLQKLGFAVTGLDLSTEMLNVAQEKARRAGLRIPFARQDMRNLALHRPVDAVTAACDGVNYLLSPGEAERFFRAAYRALKPGGVLLFDISSKYKLEQVLAGNCFGQDDGELAYLWRNGYDPQQRLLEMELSFFVREGELYRRFTEAHIQRAHARQELEDALARAGFERTEVYQAFTRKPPEEDCQRIQFAAHKTAAAPG